MFLSILNSNEKEIFLNLLLNVANSDNDFSGTEKNAITAYTLEMGMGNIEDYSSFTKKSDDIIDELKNSEPTVKRAVFMEISALMLADGLKKEEEVILEKLKTAFSFDDSYKEEVFNWYGQMIPLYTKGYTLAGLTGEMA